MHSPWPERFLDLVRAVRLAEQLGDPLEIQGLLLPLQQKDRPVTLVALEQRHQPVEQGDDLAMGLERGQSIEHRAELFAVAVESENLDGGRHFLPAESVHDLLGPRANLLSRVGEASEQKRDGRGVFHHPEQVEDRGELVDIGPVDCSLDLADGGRCTLLAPEPLGGDNRRWHERVLVVASAPLHRGAER